MEIASVTTEHSQFLNYDEAVKVNSTLFDHTNNGTIHYATRLRGSTNEQYGLAKSLSVMPGDTIRIEVFAKYIDPNSANWQQVLSDLMTSIANGTAPAGTVVDGGVAGSIGNTAFPYGGLLEKTPGGTPPKAFVNYIMFDRDVNPIFDPEQTNFIQVSELARETGTNGDHERLYAEVIAKQAGLMYIYLSNDNVELGGSAVEVFFDDFRVEHVKSPVIQMDDYYPFGLAFNSYQRENSVPNQYQYNGKEKQDELGLDWLDYGARMYQPDIGRWNAVDPLAEKLYHVSAYQYCHNNPIRFIDPNGEFSTDVVKNDDGTYTVVGGNANDGDNGIYVKNDDGSRGELIGYSATPESFYYSEQDQWMGTIDPEDQSGREFLNEQILQRNPSVPHYMVNATEGKQYDFKRTNGTQEVVHETPEEFYRGMPILDGKDGKPVYASARDIGNIAAGLVAGRDGMAWSVARLGFDGLESIQQGGFSSESTSTQYGQKLGHRIGHQIYQKTILSRLPGNAHFYSIKISKDVVKKGDL